MEFVTPLSRDQIKHRIAALTESYSAYLLRMEPDKFYSKWNRDSSFYLLRTGTVFFMRTLPFVGKVKTRDGVTVITGRFGLTKAAIVMYALFCSAAALTVLGTALFSGRYDAGTVIFLLAVLSLWTAFGYCLIRYVPLLFMKRHKQAVLKFIERHLTEKVD